MTVDFLEEDFKCSIAGNECNKRNGLFLSECLNNTQLFESIKNNSKKN